MDRSKVIKTHLKNHDHNALVPGTPEERFLMVQTISEDLYAFIGNPHAEQRLQRHIGTLVREGR
jgi:hypothetical protein